MTYLYVYNITCKCRPPGTDNNDFIMSCVITPSVISIEKNSYSRSGERAKICDITDNYVQCYHLYSISSNICEHPGAINTMNDDILGHYRLIIQGTFSDFVRLQIVGLVTVDHLFFSFEICR